MTFLCLRSALYATVGSLPYLLTTSGCLFTFFWLPVDFFQSTVDFIPFTIVFLCLPVDLIQLPADFFSLLVYIFCLLINFFLLLVNFLWLADCFFFLPIFVSSSAWSSTYLNSSKTLGYLLETLLFRLVQFKKYPALYLPHTYFYQQFINFSLN